jgi:hypothetical protein
MGRTIRGFGLDVWNLFGLDLDVVVSSLGVASSLGGLGEEQVQEVDMFSLAPLDIR